MLGIVIFVVFVGCRFRVHKFLPSIFIQSLEAARIISQFESFISHNNGFGSAFFVVSFDAHRGLH